MDERELSKIDMQDELKVNNAVDPVVVSRINRDLTHAQAATVRGFVLSLGSDSPVRQIVLDTLAQKPVASAIPLIEVLTSSKPNSWRESASAAWALGYVEAGEQSRSAVSCLIDILDRRVGGDSARDTGIMLKAIQFALIGGLMATSALVALSFLMGDRSRSLGEWFTTLFTGTSTIALLLLPIVVPCMSLIDSNGMNQVRAMAAYALGLISSPIAISSLSRASLCRAAGVRSAAREALSVVLPLVTNGHFGQLGANTVSSLCDVLAVAEDPLALLIVEALEKIGDGNAVTPIERIMSKTSSGLVYEAAERILPGLLDRKAKETNPKILLRASEYGVSWPGELLRTPSRAADNEPQNLLRSTE